jgi:hypothetical protein
MKLRFLAAIAAAAFVSYAPIAFAAPPQVPSVSSGDLFQDIPNGQPQAGNVYASGAQLGSFIHGLPWPGNAVIGGDASTNLWQRATTGASVTTTLTYGGPDRWAYWSGTSTAMTVSRDTTAADLPATGYVAGFKMARTSGQTGVVQVCMAQQIEGSNAYAFQNQTAELDFHATAGADFSAASSNVVAYIVTGTTADEALSKMAFAFNAGGGGSSTWAGQANATAAVIPISTVTGRYAAVATIPSTAKEIAVVLCFTPVGTASTNDYVTFSGIQLVRNPGLAASVSTTAGYSCTTINCSAFERRSQGLETDLQQRYYYQMTESATVIQVRAICVMSTTSIANCMIRFPTTMRIAPTMTYTAGFEASASTASSSATACTALTTSTTLTGNAASTEGVIMDCASSAGFGAAGSSGFLWDVGTGTPGGRVNASAEF